MADIEMLGGSNFHMNHSGSEGAAQKDGGSGSIEMFGGSDFHMKHSPVECAQKGGRSGEIDMVGLQGLTHKDHHVSPYGAEKPCGYGKE